VPETSVAEWLRGHAADGARIGYDPWLHSKAWVKAAREALAIRGAELVAVDANPVDAVWPDRPPPSNAHLVVHPDGLAGKSSAEKRAVMAEELKAKQADAAILSALDSIAWTFNIRGVDVDHTPVALAFAAVGADGTADLFTAIEKVGEEVIRHLGNTVRIHPRDAFLPWLGKQGGRTLLVDPERAVVAIFEALETAGARVIETRDPAVLPKAIKNAIEIAGHKAAQLRDGAALTRFLHWLSVEAPKGGLDELTASDRLHEFRRATGMLQDLSFDTISGAGPNGAIVHYRASPETNRSLVPGSLYLVDSGGQYRDGTTDVTRTVAIGTPTHEMRVRFTQVLKGHIGIARAIFPRGTRGAQLDVLARMHLWASGVDYAHGTGHGVGAYLSVHEGPQRIATSTEPGYYKAGEFGIRIENLVLVEPRAIPGAERDMLGFETLTFAPIDRALIDANLLDEAELQWINGYHNDVLQKIGPQLDAEARAWLELACWPIERE
jgi:Xaa-Pro aminopeptidase